MLTYREARHRAEIYNARITRTAYGDYMVVLMEWRMKEREDKAYFTDDLEDAVLTAAFMRRHADRIREAMAKLAYNKRTTKHENH